MSQSCWQRGNRVGECPIGIALHLITPHGDRERRGRQLYHRATRASLPLMGIGNRRLSGSPKAMGSTHYPSWGSGTQALADMGVSMLDSLPLMGIGNDASDIVPVDSPVDSLPLMGIGNSQRVRVSPAAGMLSLPLMGIGNRPAPLRYRRPRSPHYPSWGSGTRDELDPPDGRLPHSLPLMGIGNPRRPKPMPSR